MSIVHLVGNGINPSGPNHGQVTEIGKNGKPIIFAIASDFASEMYISSAPTIDTGMILKTARTDNAHWKINEKGIPGVSPFAEDKK